MARSVHYLSLTEGEGCYAQNVKEMLSIVHACKKFHAYIFGEEMTMYNWSQAPRTDPEETTP